MCGIAGALAFSDDFAVDRSTIERMTEAIAHRGPDDQGVLSLAASRVALGHRRLAIVDLSDAGHQPMPNEDQSLWIAYNGEVYNHAELRESLEASGHRYRSRTDTETIVHAWEQHGPGCLPRLHGMFAFAIWDDHRRELWLVRDRLGVKPLYVHRSWRGVAFGSEVKAILAHPQIAAELDEEMVLPYLTFAHTGPPRTLFAGIEKLGPGEWMRVSANGDVERRTWWTPFAPGRRERVRGMAQPERDAELLRLLEGSIAKRMMADVPVGVFLSGGMDSSTNVALMSRVSEKPLRTFSIAPRAAAEHDEGRWARIVAHRYGAEHRDIEFAPEDVAELLDPLAYHLDEPMGDWTAVPQMLLSELARSTGTPVIHVGEGADELLHGYRGYGAYRRAAPVASLPGSVRSAVAAAATVAATRSSRGRHHAAALVDVARSGRPFWGGGLAFRGGLAGELVSADRATGDPAADIEGVWSRLRAEDPEADLFEAMTYVDLKRRLAEMLLMRVDKTAMAHGVEVREPFLDHELVEFCLALPPHDKVAGDRTKAILRRVMDPVLPREIVHRGKQGFGVPVGAWLRGRLGEEVRRRTLGCGLVDRGVLRDDAIQRMWDEHEAGRADWGFQLWTLHTLCAWHDRWVRR